MTSEEAAVAVIDALHDLAIPYILVGSFSSNYYGIGRSTKDADFVLQLGSHSVREIADRLGPAFRLDPQMSFETVTMTTRHIVQVVSIPFRIELFDLSDDPHDQERFRRRRQGTLLDRQVMLPAVEDVIVTKLRWALGQRSKDREDVRDVIAVQGDRIDWDYVNSWCDRHGTRAVLEEIRSSIPPI
ncbi:MAG TPA: hypothetical protein VG013_29400 [Gemmataceae bacterium]|jgi:hypothetical protein|nr:hypothetical protein [Gemmataceae bacterium]